MIVNLRFQWSSCVGKNGVKAYGNLFSILNTNFKRSSRHEKQLNGFGNVWLAAVGFLSHVQIPREVNPNLKTKCGILPRNCFKLKTFFLNDPSNSLAQFSKQTHIFLNYLFSKQASVKSLSLPLARTCQQTDVMTQLYNSS